MKIFIIFTLTLPQLFLFFTLNESFFSKIYCIFANVKIIINIRTEKRMLESENEKYRILKRAARRRIESIMGKGKIMDDTFRVAEDYANHDCPLLLEGDTGVGKKEPVVYLHSIGMRGDKELFTVDCSSIAENLIETELFGCVKGAYTDAKEERTGKIEMANGSTLFLDEINSLSKASQTRLLRLIQENEITKVGGTKPIKVNVRIVAAGNENFVDLVNENRFRRDLYERFVETIRVPTLKERSEDFDFFIDRFIAENADQLNKKFQLLPK